MTTATGKLSLTKTTPSGKTAEIFYNHLAPMSQRYEVLVSGTSGGVNAGPKEINIGSARSPKMVKVIAWGDKFVELTADEVRELGGINAPQKSTSAPRCRVCGGKVNYSEQYATRGYCGCEGE